MLNRHLHDLIRHQSPITMAPGGTIRDACRQMRERRVGCVLVTEGDQLVGIFTGRDAVRLLADAQDRARPTLADLTLADAMTRRPSTLGPEASALDALRCMQDGGFRHVPIVRDGQVLGVVSRGDFRAVEHARLDEETGYWERIG